MKIYISAPRSRAHKKNTVVLILRHIQCLLSIIDGFAVAGYLYLRELKLKAWSRAEHKTDSPKLGVKVKVQVFVTPYQHCVSAKIDSLNVENNNVNGPGIS